MFLLKPLDTPETKELYIFFERILLKKLPQFEHIYNEMTCTPTEERLAFKYLKDLLTNYKPETILFVKNTYFTEEYHSDSNKPVSYLNNKFVIDNDDNTSFEQKRAMNMLEKGMFVGSFFQKKSDQYENKDHAHENNLYFSNISKEELEEVGYSDLISDRRNIHNYFWRLPFVVTETTIQPE